MIYLSCHKNDEDIGDVRQWCADNLQYHWEMSGNLGDPSAIISLTDNEDLALFKMRWQGKLTVEVLDAIAEPAFDYEILEGAYRLIDGNSGWRERPAPEEFVKEVIDWCDQNIADRYFRDNRGGMTLIGIPEEEDRILFMMKWQGNPFVSASPDYFWHEAIK